MSKLGPKVIALAATAAMIFSLVAALPATAPASPSPQTRKACSAYSIEHFHGVTAHMPDGTKCLESGEDCSHGAGFARAYREYGFVCEPNGRLEET